MTLLGRAVYLKFLSFTVSAIDITVAYCIFDLVGGLTMTWPMLVLAWWVTDTVLTSRISKSLDRKSARRLFDRR